MWEHHGHELRRGPIAHKNCDRWSFACMTCHVSGISAEPEVGEAPAFNGGDYERWVKEVKYYCEDGLCSTCWPDENSEDTEY